MTGNPLLSRLDNNMTLFMYYVYAAFKQTGVIKYNGKIYNSFKELEDAYND